MTTKKTWLDDDLAKPSKGAMKVLLWGTKEEIEDFLDYHGYNGPDIKLHKDGKFYRCYFYIGKPKKKPKEAK